MKKQELDFDLSMRYFSNQLRAGNALSQELVKTTQFRLGRFSTLVPPKNTAKNLYEFESGGLLPQNPLVTYCAEGENHTYSVIPSIQQELASFIFRKLLDHRQLSCVFEELLDSPKSPQLHTFQGKNLVYTLKNDVYYFVTGKNIQSEVLLDCIEKSNAIWHSLCVLTSVNCKHMTHNLTEENIEAIASSANLIIIGAYDGEGYVLWERDH